MRGVLALSVFVSVPTVQVVTCGLSFSAEARRFPKQNLHPRPPNLYKQSSEHLTNYIRAW